MLAELLLCAAKRQPGSEPRFWPDATNVLGDVQSMMFGFSTAWMFFQSDDIFCRLKGTLAFLALTLAGHAGVSAFLYHWLMYVFDVCMSKGLSPIR